MNDREEWRERVRDIRATSAIWWWWWSYNSMCVFDVWLLLHILFLPGLYILINLFYGIFEQAASFISWWLFCEVDRIWYKDLLLPWSLNPPFSARHKFFSFFPLKYRTSERGWCSSSCADLYHFLLNFPKLLC